MAAAGMSLPELVCVTGASGYLGSWLVKRLLEKGYRVRATVRNPGDPKKTAILRSLPGAEERLEIVRGELLEEGGFDDVVYGCDGVFLCATPTDFLNGDPYKECIEPTVNGTVNVLKACSKAPSIKRIVFTSSAAAEWFTQLEDIPGQRLDESCWTDVAMCETHHPNFAWPYIVSKTLSEKKALELAQEHNLNLVTILPSVVVGPFLIDKIPGSVATAISLVTGDISRQEFIRRINYIHIDDIIDAHIFLYETPAAQGRYNGCFADASITEIAELLKNLFPKLKLDNLDHVGEISLRYMDNSKLKELGFEFKHGLVDMFESAIKCCVEKGLLQYP